MFRRISNRISNGLSGSRNDNNEEEALVQNLQAMGFSSSQARTALSRTNGNVQQAADYLLSSGTTMNTTPNNNNNNNNAATARAPAANEDVALRNALQESLQSEEQRLYRQAQQASMHQPPKPTPRTAASNRHAGQAALSRAKNKNKKNSSKTTPASLAAHHPDVKVPARLQDKSKEEQVLRCADRLKSHPNAVDTLLKALTALHKNPHNTKFQSIDTTNAGYQRSLASAPGARSMLEAMNFRPTHHERLVLTNYDPALLFLGISALETAKQSTEYRNTKLKLQFVQKLHRVQESVNSSQGEAIRRAGYLSKCPTEPAPGRGALMHVVLGDETVQRRFDGDDELRDVVHWLGGHGSDIVTLLLSGEWCLVDKNRYPMAAMPLHLDKTLQYIGCWPSGKLELLPTALVESNNKNNNNSSQPTTMGSSRGLGAAPTDTL